MLGPVKLRPVCRTLTESSETWAVGFVSWKILTCVFGLDINPFETMGQKKSWVWHGMGCSWGEMIGQCVCGQGVTVTLYDSHCLDPLIKLEQKIVIAGLSCHNGAYHAYANLSCLMDYAEEEESQD